jgi:hypothetical protein
LKRSFIERFQFSIRNNFDLSVETIFADGAWGGWIATTAVFFNGFDRVTRNAPQEISGLNGAENLQHRRYRRNGSWLRVRQIGAYGAICRDPDASPGDGADRVSLIVSAAGG